MTEDILQDSPLLYQDMTKQYEGFVPYVYKDTRGKRTVGYGFNIDDPVIGKTVPQEVKEGRRYLNQQEADSIFDNLYGQAAKNAVLFVGRKTFNNLNDMQKSVLIDMSYNLGYPRLLKFQKLRANLQKSNYNGAAEELKNSKWFKQVGRRAEEHYQNIQSQ